MDRQLEKLLAGAGRVEARAKPILEIKPRHPLVEKLGSVGEAEQWLRDNAAYLLFDETRITAGKFPLDACAFSARLSGCLGVG